MASEGKNKAGGPEGAAGAAGVGSERALIEAALEQALPRGSIAAADGPELPPPDTFPGYELVREVHRGGQGAVYQAIQKTTKRRVAIKVMHGGPFQGSAGRARFEREVQVLGQLSHPNIVRIHDSGITAGGSCYYVMDYISGRSLDEVITESKKGPVDTTLRLFARICDAVNSAHLKGVIHRDLKPANIRVNAAGEPIVVDFGLAKTAAPDVAEEAGGRARLMTMTGQFIGSLPWASPEQAEGTPDKIDIRTDVYSLGVILYQMLTGRFPYEVAGNMRDVLDNILLAQPERPSTVRRQINDEVETIVLKCLSKERDRRYQTAGELGRDIARYLAGEPIEAKRDSGWYLLSKTLRRHRAVTGFAATVLVLIVAFAIGVSLAWVREAKERRRADANFELVRDQARTLMYDVNRAIANLRGGTKAREMLFQKARESLERLKTQAGNGDSDPGLRREIADASDLLGDIRGGLNLPKLGDTASAKESYAQARAIREALLSERPGEYQSHADMAESHKRSAQVKMTEQAPPEAQAEAARGVAEYDAAIRMASGAPAAAMTRLTDRRAECRTLEGDAWAAQAQSPKQGTDPEAAAARARAVYDEVEAYWLGRVGAEPGNTAAARWLGVTRDYLAVLTISRGANLVRRARPIMGTDLGGATALIQKAADCYGEASALAESAHTEFQRLSAERPENAEWRRDIYLAVHSIGAARMNAGDAYGELAKAAHAAGAEAVSKDAEAKAMYFWNSAATAFAEARKVTDDLAGSDQSNLQARRDQIVVQNKAGNILRNLGRLGEAEEAFGRSLEVRRDLDLTDPTPQTKRDVAVGEFKLGEVLDLEAQKAEAAVSKRELWQRAEGLLAHAAAVFEGKDKAEARARLDEVRRQLGKLPP